VDRLVDGIHELFNYRPCQLSEQEVRVYYIDDVFVGFVNGASFRIRLVSILLIFILNPLYFS